MRSANNPKTYGHSQIFPLTSFSDPIRLGLAATYTDRRTAVSMSTKTYYRIAKKRRAKDDIMKGRGKRPLAHGDVN